MIKRLTIAIDGPVGSGKSTIAKLVAKKLGYLYIDTGAMYRCVALKAKKEDIPWTDEERLTDIARNSSIKLENTVEDGEPKCLVYLDGEDVSAAIREQDIGQGASVVGKISGVRRALVPLQREMAAAGGTVMEGRDIGSVVLPSADLKIFLNASVQERTRRRHLELTEKGEMISIEEVIREVTARDEQDSTRADSPLVKTNDAVEVDTTGMSIPEVVEKIISLAHERLDKS
ncbi:MAG: (d)CMP kinase [Candidatus Tritonobacter lacicola]|nr:(d)CMP kinase [Candidatus Tritonobacter lacicola]